MFCLCSDIRHDYIYCGGGGGVLCLEPPGSQSGLCNAAVLWNRVRPAGGVRARPG